MLNSSPRAAASLARRLTVTFYLYAFLDDFVLLYPVYALLFTDTGLSVGEISSLFVIWSVTGLLLEVPSGVWADAVSRRLLLAGAPLLGAVGFGLWVAAPSYWVFALGFVLWGARSALQSGASEALLYEELDRLGLADRYGRIIGRASTFGLLGTLLATAVATPVFASGGYPAVGVASVLASLLCAAVGLALPEHRAGTAVAAPAGGTGDDGSESSGYLSILRAGLAEARTDGSVRRALLFLPAMAAIWGALEEYMPLLAADVVAPSAVPLLVLLVWAGTMVGGLLTPVGQRLSTGRFAATIAFAAVVLAAGALSGRAGGFVLIAVAFCALQMASLVADVRLQESITGSTRATVTSLAGLGSEVVTLGVFGGYALASVFAGHGVIFAVFAVPYLVLAFGWRRVAGTGPDRSVRQPAAPAAKVS
ncbi:MFS transporter [Plantactinospora soyae]|uniref:MFS family permease n=1 Tax=Plantactinospora soyae TaxID=1544732 RepID=A0A927LY76_9ACTN|nr:MFS transporter [Plantactinospora soyae]MBE1484687.1 MFS family permease [Plantactinospora soyae]